MRKCKIFLLLASSSLLLLLLAQETSAAPLPRPAPFTPGLKIGALAGAALVIKALLLTNALSGEKEQTGHISSSYGPPSDYGPPSYEPPPPITHYSPPSEEYGPPSVAYKPTYHHG